MFNRSVYLLITLLLSLGICQAETSGNEWRIAEQRTMNAVVQILVHGTEFNFLEPYASPLQFRGSGTGFFIDTDGHILTNFHVVDGAKSLFINVPAVGRFPLQATVIGVDASLDVALLKLSKEGCQKVIEACGSINVLQFADSDKLLTTQPVLAQGFPKGVGGSVKSTAGNTAGRDFYLGHAYIFITAPISPGNSGGPVVDRNGDVVGIATMHRLEAQNYNYMIPSNEIKIVLKDLYTTPFIRRPEIGIITNRGTEAHARSLGNPVPAGVYIRKVIENSVEQRAGTKVGDMVYGVTVNGIEYPVDEFGEVNVPWRDHQKITVDELLVRCRIGDKISYVLYRNGKKMKVDCLFEQPVLQPVREMYPEFEPDQMDYEMFGGLVIQPLRINHLERLQKYYKGSLDGEIAKYLQHENQTKPVLVVTWILSGSQSYMTHCFMPGFILDKVNGVTVTTLAQLRDALKKSVNSKSIAIEMKDGYTTVLDLHAVLADEERLSRDFVFPITEIVRWLMEHA